jgi:hypothetical protein
MFINRNGLGTTHSHPFLLNVEWNRKGSEDCSIWRINEIDDDDYYYLTRAVTQHTLDSKWLIGLQLRGWVHHIHASKSKPEIVWLGDEI